MWLLIIDLLFQGCFHWFFYLLIFFVRLIHSIRIAYIVLYGLSQSGRTLPRMPCLILLSGIWVTSSLVGTAFLVCEYIIPPFSPFFNPAFYTNLAFLFLCTPEKYNPMYWRVFSFLIELKCWGVFLRPVFLFFYTYNKPHRRKAMGFWLIRPIMIQGTVAPD